MARKWVGQLTIAEQDRLDYIRSELQAPLDVSNSVSGWVELDDKVQPKETGEGADYRWKVKFIALTQAEAEEIINAASEVWDARPTANRAL